MSLITDNKVKKHTSQGIVKKIVLQRLQKILSVFERKIPLTFSLEFRFHQDHA
jgi:hypothetical protein